MGRVTAFRYVKEPPGPWEIEITAPSKWAGTFRSQDGVEWWSPKLDRPLTEGNNNPGEDRILRALQGIARSHKVAQLEEVADAAALLLDAMVPSGSAAADILATTSARERLSAALQAYEPRRGRAMRPTSAGYEPAPVGVYEGDGHPDVRRARYQREPEELPE